MKAFRFDGDDAVRFCSHSSVVPESAGRRRLGRRILRFDPSRLTLVVSCVRMKTESTNEMTLGSIETALPEMHCRQ